MFFLSLRGKASGCFRFQSRPSPIKSGEVLLEERGVGWGGGWREVRGMARPTVKPLRRSCGVTPQGEHSYSREGA